MEPVENVIAGLESCISGNCESCKYKGLPCEKGKLLNDLLDVIASYLPFYNRILSPDAIENKDFVYIEFNRAQVVVDEYVEPCAVYKFQRQNGFVCFLLRDGDTYSYKQVLRLKDYNFVWRCWANKPTAYEMRNAKWIKKTD